MPTAWPWPISPRPMSPTPPGAGERSASTGHHISEARSPGVPPGPDLPCMAQSPPGPDLPCMAQSPPEPDLHPWIPGPPANLTRPDSFSAEHLSVRMNLHGDDSFEFGLDCLLDGIAVRIG